MDWILFLGFLTPIGIVFAYKAYGVYRIYRDSFYTVLYSNFIEFYYKFKHKKNLTESSWVKQELGSHKILFQSYLDKEQSVQQQFITLFYSGGIHVFCLTPQRGIFKGREKDTYWHIHRDDKNYRLPNPSLVLDAHIQRIQEKSSCEHITASILFHPKANYAGIKSSRIMGHYSQFLDQVTRHEYYDENEITRLFQQCNMKG